jgi:ribose transport system ATP-binding protein
MTAAIGSRTDVARLAVSDVSKSYPGTQALSEISLHVLPGEIHGIAGQNGAGKSTLVRILSGIEQPDGGTVEIDGATVQLGSAQAAHRAQIFTVHQELSLVPGLSVAENIYVDDLPRTRLGSVDWRTLRRRARAALQELGFDIDVRKQVAQLPIAHRQAVEIVKAVSRDARVVLLDEPTATLPRHDVVHLYALMRRLKARGISIVYVSHHFDEMYEICDRISVFRDGRTVGLFPAEESSHPAIMHAMLGSSTEKATADLAVSGAGPRLGTGAVSDDVALQVEGLSDGSVLDDVDLTVRTGEVVGVSGLTGNGQSELAVALFGARPARSRYFSVNGTARRPRSPVEAVRMGLGLLPEERKTQGLVLGMPVSTNVTMSSIRDFTRYGFLSRRREVEAAQRMRTSLRIKTANVRQPVMSLSGGNQQKVALAKWLVSGVKTLIFVEPTRGVDVGAKVEIYGLVRDFVSQGGSVLIITSEIDEALMCDRVAILRRGRIHTTVERPELELRGEAAILEHFA